MEDKCPDCGESQHDPKTGYCWLSRSRTKGFHCSNCCATTTTTQQGPLRPRKK